MKKLLGLILTLLALLGACTPHPYPPSLQTADSLTSACPDSALALLASLKDEMNSAPETTRMYYRLLCVKAGDKAYVTHTSDSVIRSVLHYYIGKNDRRHLPEAYYYAGRVYRDLEDAPQALDCFQKATELLEGSNDYRLLKVIYSQMGRLFLYQDVYEEALKAFKRSYTYQVLAGDKRGIVVNLCNIGTTFTALGNADSAEFYYKEAYKKAQNTEKKQLMQIAANALSGLYLQLKKFDLAKKNLEIYNQKEIETLVSTASMMADFYFQTGKIDSAIYYYNRLLEFDDIYAHQHAHWGLAEIASLRTDSKLTLGHLRQYNECTDSINRITHATDVRKMQSLYNYQLQEKENQRLKDEVARQIQYRNVVLFTVILFCLILTIYYLLKRYRRTIQRYQHKELVQLQTALYKKSDAFIEKNKEKVQRLSKGTIQEPDSVQHALLQAQKRHLLSQNEQIKAERKEQELAEVILHQSSIYAKFHASTFENNSKLDMADWEALQIEVNRCYKNFTNQLLALYPFSEMELKICLLLKISINITNISLLTNRSKSAIVSARKSMYRKVFKQEGKPEQWDSFIRSL